MRRVPALLLLFSMALPPASELVPVPVRADEPAEKQQPKRKYQKSRLTYDETEAAADKRRVLLTTGEDRTVDLDFDANAGANGISMPQGRRSFGREMHRSMPPLPSSALSTSLARKAGRMKSS